MEKPLKVGIIGVGSIAQCHARGFLKAGATIVNVCDLIEDEAATKAKKWGAERSCVDYTDLLKDPEVEAVDILLPPSLHAKVIVEAAEAGKHILTEKPLATTLEDCDAAISAAKQNNVKLMVCHNQLFYPPHQEARRLVESDEIGTPIMSTSLLHGGFPASGWRENPVIGGGFLLEACIHRFYVSRFLMGEVKRVSCMTGKTTPDLETENIVLVNLEFEKNRFGTISANRGAPPALWDDRTEVVGEDGMIIINGVEDHILGGLPLMLYKDGAWKSYMTPRVFGETAEGMESGCVPEEVKFTENEIDNNFVNTFYYVIKHFIDCVQEDKEPFVSGEEGRRLVEIMLAAYKSAEIGSVVDV
jgi:UDP-N-acetylglucosamine 3-dehydrogenase